MCYVKRFIIFISFIHTEKMRNGYYDYIFSLFRLYLSLRLFVKFEINLKMYIKVITYLIQTYDVVFKIVILSTSIINTITYK